MNNCLHDQLEHCRAKIMKQAHGLTAISIQMLRKGRISAHATRAVEQGGLAPPSPAARCSASRPPECWQIHGPTLPRDEDRQLGLVRAMFPPAGKHSLQQSLSGDAVPHAAQRRGFPPAQGRHAAGVACSGSGAWAADGSGRRGLRARVLP